MGINGSPLEFPLWNNYNLGVYDPKWLFQGGLIFPYRKLLLEFLHLHSGDSGLFEWNGTHAGSTVNFRHTCLSDLFTTSEWCPCAFRWLCPSVKRWTPWVTLAQRSPTAMLNIHSFLLALVKCQTCVKRNAEHVTWWSGALFSTWMMGTAWGRRTVSCGGQRQTLLWWTRIPQCMRQATSWKNTAKRQGPQRLLFSQVSQ